MEHKDTIIQKLVNTFSLLDAIRFFSLCLIFLVFCICSCAYSFLTYGAIVGIVHLVLIFIIIALII